MYLTNMLVLTLIYKSYRCTIVNKCVQHSTTMMTDMCSGRHVHSHANTDMAANGKMYGSLGVGVNIYMLSAGQTRSAIGHMYRQAYDVILMANAQQRILHIPLIVLIEFLKLKDNIYYTIYIIVNSCNKSIYRTM